MFFTDNVIIILVSIVALISFVLASIGVKAYTRSKDPKLLSVTLAFGAFFFKNILIMSALAFSVVDHGHLESIGAMFDLLTMILLISPVFMKTPQNISSIS